MASATSSDDWDLECTDHADRQFGRLGPTVQERIIAKLDDIVTNEWRDPPEHLEPFRQSPFSKLRVGGDRPTVNVRHESQLLRIESVDERERAHVVDDD